MKLLRLKLENFRQHRETDIRFCDGMTAIVGANGTGKTTLLEAITFALYGVQRKTRETVKFYWAEPRAKVRVLLEFEFEARRYSLERSSSEATLTDLTCTPSVVRATGLREVKAACERLLRLTYDQFRNSFCAEQKSLAFLQFNTDTRRQEQVAKMLGFDRLKSAGDLARERGRVLRSFAEHLAASMGDIEDLRGRRAACSSELQFKEDEKKRILARRSEVEKGIPEAEERKKWAEEFIRLSLEANVFASNAEVLKSAKKRAEEALGRAAEDAARRKELEPASLEFSQLETAIREMQTLREQELDREKLQAEQTRLEADIKSLTDKLAALAIGDLDCQRKVLHAAIAAHTESANALRAAEAAWSRSKQLAQGGLSTVQSELKQVRAALAKAEDLAAKGICPECEQPTIASFAERLALLNAGLKLKEEEYALAEKEFKIADARPKSVFDAEDKVEADRKAHATSQDQLTLAEKSHSEAKALGEERTAKEARVAALQAELAKIAQKYTREAHLAAETRLRDLRPQHESYLKLAGAEQACLAAQTSLKEAQAEIETARCGYTALIAERNKLPFLILEEANEAVVAFETLRHLIRETEANAKVADALLENSKASLAQIEERIKTYNDAAESLKEGRAEALHHEVAEKELKLLREELNAVIRPDLSARASENLSLLTNGRYSFVELDEEFNPTVIEDGVAKQVISGGEEDVVALALRMSLSELIQERQGRPMSLMILDEVFGSLDADRRQAVLERLHAIKGRFEQILVISHIEEINQVADQCIFLSRNEDSRSTQVGDLPIETQLALL